MTCNDGKESFVMYNSFLKAAENLSGDEFKECVLKMRNYALYGVDPVSENQLVNIILIMAKPNLKAAADRYQRCVDNGMKGKEFGGQGGRPRKGETREEYKNRKGLGKTPRKPLNDDVNGYEDENENGNRDVDLDDYVDVKITVKEKEKEKEKENWIKEVPSGQGTSKVPTPKFISSSVSIESSNHSEGTAEASNTADAEQETSNLNSPIATTNSVATSTNEEYVQELRGYLTLMAKYALGIINLEDFDDTLGKAIQCYMGHNGVSKAKAAKAIEQGILNYKEGIQGCLEAKKQKQEATVHEEEVNDEPF